MRHPRMLIRKCPSGQCMSGQPMNMNIYRSERDTRGIVYASIETTGTEFSIVKSLRRLSALLRCVSSGVESGVIWHPVADAPRRCLNIMVLVKPATVVQWHRQGFRLYWRWNSRPGRPSVAREIRDLIRQMNSANPLWSAPRIHSELLKFGIEVSRRAACA
jgi:hypothetical protein